MAHLNFNASEIEAAPSIEPLPPGRYSALVTASEIKTTRAGTGSYLELTFEIIAGEYASRKVWARFNLNNPNPVAVDIARQELAALCRAVNIAELEDSEQLHNRPLVILLRNRPSHDGGVQTEIRGYFPEAKAAPATPAADPAKVAPWLR